MSYFTQAECKERYFPLKAEVELVTIHIIYPERGDLWVIESDDYGTHLIQIDDPIPSDTLSKGKCGAIWQVVFVSDTPVAVKNTEHEWTSCKPAFR